jgi:hypothetical protein
MLPAAERHAMGGSPNPPGFHPVIAMAASGHTERSHPSRGLQLDEDPQFQARMWRIERLGWWAIVGIILAAAAGLFGHGLASRATMEITDPAQRGRTVTLDYERFGRAHSESHFIVSRQAGSLDGGTWSLWLSGDYLAGVEGPHITPGAVSEEPVSDGVRYRFPVREGPQTVLFRFRPQQPGSLSGSFRVNDGPPATFHQWLFP